MLLGIDVSHYTGPRNWHGLTDKGIAFAYVKATEGSTIKDDLFDHHWRGLHDAKVPCGAYHFGHPGSDPAAQAAHFHSVVGPLAPGDLQPVLDLETGDRHTASTVIDWTLDFVRAAEALFGARLIIYTGGFWRRDMGNPICPPLSDRKLWTARYGGQQPVLPAPWSTWAIWQFSDNLHNAPPEAAVLGCNCDWNRLADGLSVRDLTVAANRSSDGAPNADAPVALDPSARPAWPGRYLVYPANPVMSGEDIRRWQTQMRERGWALAVDGVYGRDARSACVSLQRHEGMIPDGIVGPRTWQATFAPL
jgi:hypothetical protein